MISFAAISRTLPTTVAKALQYSQSKGVPVLLDAKRGDIGNAAEQYARELF